MFNLFLIVCLIALTYSQDPNTVCNSKKGCCECAASSSISCAWDTEVARKRDVLQTAACQPAAARKRDVDSLDKRAIVVNPAACPCGDGDVCAASGEECDEGANNGKPDSCCTANCKFKTSSTVCRSSKGPCDIEEKCSGRSGSCPSDRKQSKGFVCDKASGECENNGICDGSGVSCSAKSFKSSNTVCRKSDGSCDIEEKCTGSSASCPSDKFKASGTVCRAAKHAICDIEEKCPGNSADCPSDKHAADGTVCKAKATPNPTASNNFLCDADDVCDNGECESTAVSSRDKKVCRAAKGPCDREELCTGSEHCGTDRKYGSSRQCRASADLCDRPDVCDGKNDECPPDQPWYKGRPCRPKSSSNACDVAEVCDGVSFACPADAVQPAGYVCRTMKGACDIEEKCDGKAKTCPSDKFHPSGHVCKKADGVCDLDDVCTGTSASCQAKFKKDEVCRQSQGLCDVEEKCTGSFADCPSDRKRSSSHVCRKSEGLCDIEEKCDGKTNDCPDDTFRAKGYECRKKDGVCDLPEVCDGVSEACPYDQFESSSKKCRSAGECEEESFCPGDGSDCPANQRLSTGTSCKHANMCLVETKCDANGRCSGGRSTCQCLKTSDCKSDDPCAIPKCNTSTGQCEFSPARAGTVCRTSKGDCDVEEVCDGKKTACPADEFKPSSTVCRASKGDCDIEEKCTGFSKDCPANEFAVEKDCGKAPGPCHEQPKCDGKSEDCPVALQRQVGVLCDDGDKCTTEEKCTAKGTCEGKYQCECRVAEDCFPVARRKRAFDPNATRIEDLCNVYECLPDKTCKVERRKSCDVVGECEAGTGGCECKPDGTCDTSIFPLKCNKQVNKCETRDPSCIPGAPGCPCADDTCQSVAKRNAENYFLRCVDDMCRIDKGSTPRKEACSSGSEGCVCRTEGNPCDIGTCVDGFCTANCKVGTAGCACSLSGDRDCVDDKTVCKTGRCIHFTEDCGASCVRGEPGCCCLEDDTCTPVQRKRTTFIYTNVCNSDKMCVIEALPPPEGGDCGEYKTGSSWQADGKTCHCTDFGELCDELDCYATKDEAACGAKTGCHWGTVGYFGDGCYNKKDYPNAASAAGIGVPTEAPNIPCEVNADGEYYCENGAKCDTVSVTCPIQSMVAVPEGESSDASTLKATALLIVAMIFLN